MKHDTQSLLLLIAGAVFFLYLVTRMLAPSEVLRDESFFAARRRIAECKRRARDSSLSAADRAAALREAAIAALESLRRPALAASYARRAERLDPQNPDSLGILARALTQGSKYQALERMLWRWLAEEPATSPTYARAFDELVALYDGPLNRPEMATSLRRMRAPS
ncbi:MAG TPA: hypothetical protein VHM25_17905 [Polyangiaceae bacterium]|jgi:hypothetical protein|nr:hypothetical protein [Polyangiaceae bacterium]